jgi:hypothetical protein
MINLDEYIQGSKKYYDYVFDKVEHSNVINGVDVDLHFKYLKFDPNGNPKIDKLIEILFMYFTHYCFSSQKRNISDLDDIEKELMISKLKDEARELFRKWKEEDITDDNQPKSGEIGEIILWLFMEVILKAPQVVAKMDLKTNTGLEVFGSDGIHVKINEDMLNIYFGEAKLYNDIYKALDSVFESLENFHEDAQQKQREYNLVTTHYKYLNSNQKDDIYKYITNQISQDEVKINHACLVGYDWNEYLKLGTEERKSFIENFTSIYEKETERLTKLIQTRFDNFSRKEFSFDVFFIPFNSVQEIRDAFNAKL